MNPDAWGAVGVVVAAIVAYLGVRYTSQQSARAQKVSVAMEEKAIDAAAYERARASYEAAIAQYLREIARLEQRVSSLNDRIATLNGDVVDLEASKREQRWDLEATIEQLVAARSEYEDHLRRCKARLGRLRARLEMNGGLLSEDDPDLQVEP